MSNSGEIINRLELGAEEGAPPVNDRNEDPDDDAKDAESVFGQTTPHGRDKGLDADDPAMKERKKRRKAALMLAICLMFIGLMVALILIFKPEEGGKARAFEDEDERTNAPTASPIPIDENTPPPTSLTPPPSPPPTQAPTFDDFQPLSLRSCDEITSDLTLQELAPGTPFKEDFVRPDGRLVCADTYVGFPRSPDRNPWTAKVGQKDCEVFTYDEGTEICESVGARRCTADELQFQVGQGTGCFGDNTLLYSSTECEEGGVEGIYTVNLEFKKNLATFFECQTDLNHRTLVRCCADHF